MGLHRCHSILAVLAFVEQAVGCACWLRLRWGPRDMFANAGCGTVDTNRLLQLEVILFILETLPSPSIRWNSADDGPLQLISEDVCPRRECCQDARGRAQPLPNRATAQYGSVPAGGAPRRGFPGGPSAPPFAASRKARGTQRRAIRQTHFRPISVLGRYGRLRLEPAKGLEFLRI